MKARIVVGLGFGDEGKGMTTDYLCSKSNNPVVVRFNGGHQAGHTVIRNNIKHVHSSFGSGTLLGIPSYISDYCCFYPPAIEAERDDLKSKGISPVLVIHPLAKVTTPYDIAYNRMIESRLRHGSVGVGIGATFSRNTAGYRLHACDLTSVTLLEEKLNQISNYYFTQKLWNCTEAEIDYFKKICEEEFIFFYNSLKVRLSISSYDYLKLFDTVIFEGAQGIMLDMEFGSFPNVTYSHCTSRNALSICHRLDIFNIEIDYVTRCYTTRHGNGWIPNQDKIELINTEEEINMSHNWQGNFRTGELDMKIINYALSCDDNYSSRYSKNLHITCMDQRPDYKFPYKELNFKFKNVREQSSPHAVPITTAV